MKVGLALSGGGVRGAAHIGLIQALQEENIEITSIAGTSIGAIVASLYAMGYTTQEMLKIFEYTAKELFRADTKYLMDNVKQKKGILGLGVWSGNSLEDAIDACARMKQKYHMQDIELPIRIPTVDIVSGEKYVSTNQPIQIDNEITDISIGKAVRASASYPRCICPLCI